MIDWELLKKECDSLNEQLTNPELDKFKRGELQKKASQYSHLISKHNEIVTTENNLEELKKLSESDSELKELYDEEIQSESSRVNFLKKELEDILYPPDELDDRSVFLEIRAGAGGQEAALFVYDLYKMYSAYALSRNWQVSVVDSSDTDLGGLKEIILHIKGKGVYKYLKFESGVHRVQRVPATETQGRIHTSTVTVAVLPEIEDVDIKINPQDLRIDVFRASGAGGQHVNTTDSAVRIIHIPSGIVVSCQDERSQIKNKAKGLKILQARLYEAERQRKEAELSAQRKQQMGAGERAEKIRTYNYPQNRITDHRVEVTLKKLDIVMQGVLDDLLEPLIEWDRGERKKYSSILPQSVIK